MRTIVWLCLGFLGACYKEQAGTPPGLLRSFGLAELQGEGRVELLSKTPAREFTGEVKIKNPLHSEGEPVIVKISWGVADTKFIKKSPDENINLFLAHTTSASRNRIISLKYEITQSQPGMHYTSSGFSTDLMYLLQENQYLNGSICFDTEWAHLTGVDKGTGYCKWFYVLACGSVVDADSLSKKRGHIEVTESPCKLEFKDTPPSSIPSSPASTPSGTQPSTSPAPH